MNIKREILASIETKIAIARNHGLIGQIEVIGNQLIKTLKNGGKVLVAGNGGSASDAQHFVAELAGKFIDPKRQPLPAVALHTNSSIVTAIANDFGYDHVFSRQVEALGTAKDIFIGISTSGNSQNIIQATETARKLELLTIGLLGNGGGKIKQLCDLNLIVPSDNTQNIQEAHIMLIHIWCGMIDEAFKIS